MILAWILCREGREKRGRGRKIVYNIPIHTVY
jgi:hypothetical protein